MADCFGKIKMAFPRLQNNWFSLLREILTEEKFSDPRLIDATSNLIKTCLFPEPTIANLISYDKKTKLLTYKEMTERLKEDSKIFDR